MKKECYQDPYMDDLPLEPGTVTYRPDLEAKWWGKNEITRTASGPTIRFRLGSDPGRKSETSSS